MKRRLRIDLDELEFAMQTDSYEMHYYLDLETGEIILIMDEFARELETIYGEIYDEEGNRVVPLEEYLEERGEPEWQKKMLLDADRVEEGYHERYIPIRQDNPHADYNDMERFIPTVEDAELRERLWRAIRGRGAFRYFKDVVWEHPDVREDWFAFKNARRRRRVERWLEARDIEPIRDADVSGGPAEGSPSED
jgi:hypothetical protein